MMEIVKYSKSKHLKWAVFTPPTEPELAASIIISATEAGKQDNPDNPFTAVVTAAEKTIAATVVATAATVIIVIAAEEEQ